MKQSLGAKAVISRSRPYRSWTSDDTARLRRLVRSGMTDARIGEEMGRDRPYICRKRQELGIARGVSPAMAAILARINMRRRFHGRVAA